MRAVKMEPGVGSAGEPAKGRFNPRPFTPSPHLPLAFLVLVAVGCTPVTPGMVYIPAGPFVMGTDQVDDQHRADEFGILKPWFEDERPAHTVNLPAYHIDKYEVTNADYQVFVQATRRRAPPEWQGAHHPPGLARHPVVSVTWFDADAYCRWAEKRLPTEAEWEKAARSYEGRLYPWGNAFDLARANIGGAKPGPVPVGSYPSGQTQLGVFDLVGNVWEWTADWYGPYPGSTVLPREDPPAGRVLRGSSWSGVGHFPPDVLRQILAHNTRASFRLYADPNGRLNDVGFRCALSADGVRG